MDISSKPAVGAEGREEEGLHAATHAIDKFRFCGALPRGDERAGEGEEWRGCVAAGLSDTRETARKFSGPVSRLLQP